MKANFCFCIVTFAYWNIVYVASCMYKSVLGKINKLPKKTRPIDQMVGFVLLIFGSFLCYAFCFIRLRYVSCAQFSPCLWIVHSWLPLNCPRVSGLFILDCPSIFPVSLDCSFLIAPQLSPCLWIVHSWLPLNFPRVSGLFILDCPSIFPVSLNFSFLIAPQFSPCFWIVHSWLPLNFPRVSGWSFLMAPSFFPVSLDCSFFIAPQFSPCLWIVHSWLSFSFSPIVYLCTKGTKVTQTNQPLIWDNIYSSKYFSITN